MRQRQKRLILPNCTKGTLILHDIQKATESRTEMDEPVKLKLRRKININTDAMRDVMNRHTIWAFTGSAVINFNIPT
jgi:hypothetical protein